jgi:general nucleoside transport system permease protein
VTEGLTLFAEATVRMATPLALAALGEVVAERSGVINLGIEGALIGGAFGALVAAGSVGPVLGLAGGVVGGMLVALVFAAVTIGGRADQIIAGTAISLLGLGLTGVLYRAWYGTGGAALTTPTLAAIEIPGLVALPIVGRALFAQPLPTYLLVVLAVTTWWWMFRTHSGLSLRACGESPSAARVAGIAVRRVQLGAVLFAGALAGLGGATLVLAQAGTFAEGMSAGRGFIAVAIVVLGRWHPLGTLLAAVIFGAASALQTLFQALGSSLPYQLFLALPHLLTLAALAGFAGRSRAPAALGVTQGED